MEFIEIELFYSNMTETFINLTDLADSLINLTDSDCFVFCFTLKYSC